MTTLERPSRFSRTLASFPSTVGVIVKSHALDGPGSRVRRSAAEEFVVALQRTLLGLTELKALPPPSREVFHALDEVTKRILYEGWHAHSLRHPRACQRRLSELAHRYGREPRPLLVERVVVEAAAALGFTVAAARDHSIRREDYGSLFPEAPTVRNHKAEMLSYIAGERVRLIVVVGDEENVALQIMKLCLRNVLQAGVAETATIPGTRLPRLDVENYVHVCDPDSPENAYILETVGLPEGP